MPVRTTLTLDEDVARMLERAAAERGVRPKDVVNEVLRAGLQASRTRRRSAPYRMKPVDLGRCLVGDIADVATALAAAEGDRFR
jgi:hypothetical protein